MGTQMGTCNTWSPFSILLRGVRIKTVAFPGAVALHAHFVAFGHLWTTKKTSECLAALMVLHSIICIGDY